MAVAISGLHLLRALTYASKASPKDDARARLQHIVFLDHRIIGADGERWHVGTIPEESAVAEPFAATRASVSRALLTLDYCRKMAKALSANFEVHQEGPVLVIRYAKEKLKAELDVADVGDIGEWQEPVPTNAPELDTVPSGIPCGHLRDALGWHRSWEKDSGEATMYGHGDGRPVRTDIMMGGDLVAQAYILPKAHPPAQLADIDPLFVGKDGAKASQAITALRLVGSPADPPPKPEQAPARKRKKKQPNGEAPADNTAE